MYGLPSRCKPLSAAEEQVLLALWGCAPATRRELVVSVQMLLRMGERLGRLRPPRRSAGEQALIDRAKERLMQSRGLSEEEAYRQVKELSRRKGGDLAAAAREILSGKEREK